MIQSKYSRERECIFREVFNSEFDTRKNGGTPTDVTYTEGKGVFNGSSSYINIPKRNYGEWFNIDGKIDDVRVYSGILTQEVSQLYTATKNKYL